MKKIITLLMFASICLTSALDAQVKLQFTLDSTSVGGQFYWTDLGNNEIKYIWLNYPKNSFSIYNLDMSPYMINIKIPPVAGDSLNNGYTVVYVTKSLFDCDSTNIEYAYDAPNSDSKPFFIYRTDGTLLFKRDSANGPYCYGCYGGAATMTPIFNTPFGARLFLQTMDAHQYPELQIYSLCGTLPTGVYDFSQQNNSYVRLYPNPSSMQLNFEITPPTNQDNLKLVLLDENSKEIAKKSLSDYSDKYSLDVSQYSSGVYFYSLQGTSKVYQTGKFIITK